jgi:hypothetical protein
MRQIFRIAESAASLGEDIAAILESLKNLDDDQLRELANALSGGDFSPSLKALLSVDQQTALQVFFGKIIDEIDPPGYIKKLLSPVGSLTQEQPLAWSFTKAETTDLPAPESLTISLGGSLAASIVMLPKPTYRIVGKLGMSSSLKAPFSYGSVGTSLSASAQSEVSVAFNHRAKNPLAIEALVSDLSIVCQLGELAVVSKPKFSSASFAVSGQVKIAADLSAGKTFSVQRNVAGNPITAEVRAGANYSVSWAKSGNYVLKISRMRNSVRVSLTEEHVHETARTLSVGAEIKISGLKDAVAPLMKRISELPSPIEDAIKKYSSPGTILKDKLGGALSGQSELVVSLSGVVLGDRSADNFVDQLVQDLSDSVDERGDRLAMLINGRFEELVADFLVKLPVVQDEEKARLAALLEEKLSSAVEGYKESIDERIRALLGSHPAELTNALSQFSDGVDTLSGSLGDRASKLLRPFEKAVLRYREYEEKITDAIETIEKEKLAIAYSRSVTKKDKQELLISVMLKDVNSATSDLYRKMLTGDFSDAMKAGKDSENSSVELEDSVFTRTFNRNTTSGITVNFFGKRFSSNRSLGSELKITTTGGEISVLQGIGDATSTDIWLDEKLSVKISSLNNLIEAGADEEALGLHVTYQDADLHPGEIKEHLFAFERRGLIAEGATERTLQSLAGHNADEGFTFTTIASYTRNELQFMAETDEKILLQVAVLEQVKSLEKHGTGLRRLQKLKELYPDYRLSSTVWGFRGKSTGKTRRALDDAGARGKIINHLTSLLYRVNKNSENLRDYFEIWEEFTRIEDPLVAPDGSLDSDVFEKLEDMNKAMTENLGGWARASGVVREPGSGEMSPWSFAFVQTLQVLSQRKQNLVPIVSWKEEGRVKRIALV